MTTENSHMGMMHSTSAASIMAETAVASGKVFVISASHKTHAHKRERTTLFILGKRCIVLCDYVVVPLV